MPHLRKIRRGTSGVGLLLLLLLLPRLLAAAEDGVLSDRIVFGQVAALDGPAGALGRDMRRGLCAAFDEANHHGGVDGRRLDLLSIDDGYEPAASVKVVKSLIRDRSVFALIGGVGTPTAAVDQPIANDAGLPFIGAFTGAEFLREPYKPMVVNVRASYAEEAETIVDHLTRDLAATRIAIFYQEDAFGWAGLDGVRKALARRRLELVAEGAYQRNTDNVAAALAVIKKGDPQAVVLVAAYQPAAVFIRGVRGAGLDPAFLSVSFVGAQALAAELGEEAAGVVVTQVTPSPWDPGLALAAGYRAALHASDRGLADYVSFEGYIAGRLAVEALRRIKGEITRTAFLDVVARREKFDLGGFVLAYGLDDNRGSSQVFLTMIDADGLVHPIDRLTKH